MTPYRPLFPLDSPRLSRRSFLGASGSMLVALSAGRARGNEAVVMTKPSFTAYPFQLGVASGDPSADGFVLWTRLAPQPLAGGGMPREAVWVQWQVAEDEAMTKIVASGKEIASPDWGTRSTSRSPASSPTAGTGINSKPVPRPARAAAPARSSTRTALQRKPRR